MIEPRSQRYDAPFLRAAQIAAELVAQPEVAGQWTNPSALPAMSVGALACHLGRQLVRANDLLARQTTDTPLDSALDHYGRAAWVTATSLDDPANDRTLDDSEAGAGFAALQERVGTALAGVRDQLTGDSAVSVVRIPWQEWSLRRNDFLLTRMLEIVVHSDDLAVSVQIGTPEFPPEVFAPVLELLATLATRRHGQSAVIGALSRTERAPRSIAAF